MLKKLHIRLASMDSRVDSLVEELCNVARKAGWKAVPIPLPTKRSLITVLRSPFIYKKHMDKFEMREHKRAVIMLVPEGASLSILNNIKIPAGIDIKIVKGKEKGENVS